MTKNEGRNQTTTSSDRVLLVANEAIEADEVGRAVLDELGEAPADVFVVAPALIDSALKHHMGDVDEAVEPAAKRLETSLEWLRAHGFTARGEVGDSDPLIAASDEVEKFQPSRILVIAHAGDEAAYAEQNLASRAERDLDQPIKEILVSSAGARPRVVDQVETSQTPGRAKGERRSRNFPPLTKRDISGIAVAVVGTIVLGALASAVAGNDQSPNLEEGRLSGLRPAVLLIAVGMALLNLAHVVGLIFFQSVRYTGPFERFFAQLSLIGTPIAVGIAALFLALD